MNWNEAYHREHKVTWDDIATAIHDLVTVEQVLRFYRPDLEIRHHRCACPIHNGRDPNFSFTENGYKCFVCGASGDVIALVKEVCELSTRADAMKKINLDFNLRLPLGGEISATQSADLARKRKEAEDRRKAQEEWERGYSALMDEWCRLDRMKIENKVGSEPWLYAIRNIDRVGHELSIYPERPR